MSEQLQRRAAVLGASARGGVGWCAAEILAEDGFRVHAGARTRAGLEELAHETGAQFSCCDATNETDIALYAQRAAEEGKLDVAILAAGVGVQGEIASIAEDRLRAAFELSFFAGVYFIRHIAPHIKPGGAIILVSTIAAHTPWPGYFAYGCAKSALETLTAYAALEYGPKRVRINAIRPGPLITPGFENAASRTPGLQAAMTSETPLGEMTRPEHAARLAVWLAEAESVTGVCVPVDGGLHLRRPPDLPARR